MLPREPYRLFFPLGIALVWAGLLHWVLHAFGWLEDYRLIFHAMTQVQGFLACFAVGFLFTMIPRRTESPPPAMWQIVVCAIAPVGTVVSAWLELWPASQVFWLVLCSVMLGFLLPRFGRRGARKPPDAFVWIPFAFAFGILASLITSGGAILGKEYWWLHTLGRKAVLQGVFLCLVTGVAGLVIPFMTRGEKPANAAPTTSSRRARALHLLGGLLLVASFGVEHWVSLRAGLFFRGAVVGIVLLVSVELHRPPTKPGLTRRMMWLACWMLPIGYAIAAIFPHHHKAGLHVVFVGGFSLLTFAVGTQVGLGHSGRGDLNTRWPALLVLTAGLLLLAIVPRVLMEIDKAHYFQWMGAAAASFLIGSLCWCVLVFPKFFAAMHAERSAG